MLSQLSSGTATSNLTSSHQAQICLHRRAQHCSKKRILTRCSSSDNDVGKRVLTLSYRRKWHWHANSHEAALLTRRVAEAVVQRFIQDGQVVAFGHGSLAAAFIEALADRRAQGKLKHIQCIPATDSAAAEAAMAGLPMVDPEQHDRVDVMVSSVDEIDQRSLSCMLGQDSAPLQLQLPRLRRLLSLSDQFVALVDDPDKVVDRLAGDLPVFIDAEDWEDIAEELDDAFLGDAEIWRRPANSMSELRPDPRGGAQPYVSSTGEAIVDIKFDQGLRLDGRADAPYQEITRAIERIPGVVAHGLVVRSGIAAVVATAAGPAILMQHEAWETATE